LREYKLILKAIDHFKLNLNGLTELTEAASGNYKWGPIIAAKAGAKVIAFTKNSHYGSIIDINQVQNSWLINLYFQLKLKLFQNLAAE
jgi:hypothetical protein